MDELKPCLFCGEAEKIEVTFTMWRDYWVICRSCGSGGPVKNTKKEAIEAWNRREGEHD